MLSRFGIVGLRGLFLPVLVGWVVASGAAPPPLMGQVRESQVPIDEAGTVLDLTPNLRTATGLVPDAAGFQVARVFELEDGGFVLEVSWAESGRLTRERTPLSTDELAELRQRVSEALARTPTAVPIPREGRGGLVWGATGLGLGFYGWAIPASADVDDGRTAVATYLLTAASSFYLPYRLTRNRAVTDAHRSLSLWAATRGAIYGGTLGLGLADRGDRPVFEDDDDAWRVALAVGTATSVVGGVLGFKAVDWTGIDEGTAQMRGTLIDFSTAAGFGVAYAAGLYDEKTVDTSDGFPVREEPDLLPPNLLALAATGIGAWGASRVGGDGAYTPGDVHVLRSFGLMGAQALLPVANLVDEDEAKTHVAGAILGAAPGLYLGNRLLRDESFSGGNGVLVAAGHLAGGLLGAGLTYLVDPDTDRDELIYMTTSALGSAAGLAFTYRALRGDGDQTASSYDRAAPGRGDVQVSLNPTGLLPVLAGGSSSGAPVRTPLVTLTW